MNESPFDESTWRKANPGYTSSHHFRTRDDVVEHLREKHKWEDPFHDFMRGIRHSDLRDGDGRPFIATSELLAIHRELELGTPVMIVSPENTPRESNIGAEAVSLLRGLRRAYYAGSAIWGIKEADRMTGYAFIRAFERAMFDAGKNLQAAIMRGGAHS